MTAAAVGTCLTDEGVIAAPTGDFAPPLDDIASRRAFAVSFASFHGEIAIDRATLIVARSEEDALEIEMRFRHAGGALNEVHDDVWDPQADVFGNVAVFWDAKPTDRARSIVEQCARARETAEASHTPSRAYTSS